MHMDVGRWNGRALVLLLSGVAGLVLGGCTTVVDLQEQASNSLERDRLVDAEQYLEEAEERRPASWRTQYLYGKLRLKQGQPLDAQLRFQRARAMLGEGEAMDEILDLTALSLYRQGPEAYPSLVAFLQETVATYGRVDDYLRQGSYLMLTSDYDNALIAMNKALAVADEEDPRPYVALADLYAAVGKESEAVEQLRYAYWLDPEDESIHARLRELGVVPGPTVGIQPPKKGM